MSNIEIGQVWKNHLDRELTIVAPGSHRLRVLSDDIWIAEVKLMTPPWDTYVVTKKSLADAGYKLTRGDR